VQEEDAGARWFTDEWGITWRMPLPHGYYYDIARHPLAGATWRGAAPCLAGSGPIPRRRAGLREAIQAVHTGGALRRDPVGHQRGGPMELGAWLAGFQQLFAALIADPALADELLDRAPRSTCAFGRPSCRKWEYVDIISGEPRTWGVQGPADGVPRTFARTSSRGCASSSRDQSSRPTSQSAAALRRARSCRYCPT